MSEPNDLPPLDGWPEHRAAPGFADRVMAALEPPPRRRRSGAVIGFVAGAAIAALATWWVIAPRDRARAPAVASGPRDGTLIAVERTHAPLGDAAIAVAEPGAELRWQTREGRLAVEQPRGRVFYRASRPFSVQTPRGALEVTGTSFSVESAPAFTDLVVYEGAVIAAPGRAKRIEIAAGRRVRITARGIGPDRPAPWLDEPPAPSSVATIARAAPAQPTDCTDTVDVSAPDAATLAEWARTCRLHFDVAPNGYDPAGLEYYLDLLGVSDQERPVVRDTILAIEARANAELARQYVDVTGDDRGPDAVSVDWMFSELMRSADPDEPAEVRRRLARERAGLEAPPAASTPYEEQVRWLMRSGDVLERELAAKIGASRSHELRARNRGWPGLRWDVEGCPTRE
jgi:hypothetical protein